MDISYVLPVYNAQNTIAQCIKSLLKQDITPHEIIVIDDCSTDYTARILKHYEKDITKIITNDRRKGAAFCRNLGNSLCTSDIIAVCDSDVYYRNRCVAIKEFFENQPDKSIFYSGLHCRSSKNPEEQWDMEAYEWDFNSKCPISHPTIAYKKQVCDEVKYHEDSIETDLFEFFLLDAHKKGYLMSGCQNPLMLKIEGDRKRNRKKSDKIKAKKYKEYGIKIV